METAVTFDKVKQLIYDLISTELWKMKVMPLIGDNIHKLGSMKSYICLYHEGVVCNLLEIMLFHRTAVDSADEKLIDLIDYIYRKLVWLTNYKHKEYK